MREVRDIMLFIVSYFATEIELKGGIEDKRGGSQECKLWEAGVLDLLSPPPPLPSPPPHMILLATKLSFLVNKGLNYVKLRQPPLYLPS